MKFKFYLLVLFTLGTGLSQIVAESPNPEHLAAAEDGFAFKLLKELAAEQPVTNIFISPYSAETVLQMVANGAVGKTKTEMQQVLGTTSLSDDSVNQASQRIARSLNTGNTNVILTTAKAIWYRQGTPVRPSFLVLNQQFSDATVAPIDFADPHSVDIINAWAAEKTHGKITHIADGMIDPLYSRLFLANAVYFKGKWLEPFDANDTKERPFHLRDGAEKNVPMMTQSKTFTYRHGTGYQAVRLPYQDENLAMYVFLPETNSRPEKLLSIMSGNTWNRITKPGFSEKEGMLMLPRFKMEYSIEMVKPLKSLGMKLAFDDVNADFSGIASNLYISAVRQKTYIEVKEEGTEAVAATAESVQAGGPEPPRPDPFQMIVDRPFLFLIEDNQTGTILFMGVVFDPRTD